MLDLSPARPATTIAVAALSLCVAMALAARADAYVYWTNSGTDTIGRAEPRRHRRQPELHHRRHPPARPRGRRRPRLLGERRHGHDRPRQPRRHRRQPELHPRRRRPAASRSMPTTSTGRTATAARSAAPTSTARGANQSFITGASDPTGVAVDAATSTGRTAAPDTIGRADLDGTDVNQSFITGAAARRRRGRRPPHLLGELAARRDRPRQSRRQRVTRALSSASASRRASRSTPATSTGRTTTQRRSAAPTSTAPASNQSFISRRPRALCGRRGRRLSPPAEDLRPNQPAQDQDHQGRIQQDQQDQGQVQVQVLEPDSTFECKLDQEVEVLLVAEDAQAPRRDQAQVPGPRDRRGGQRDPTPAKDKFKVAG